MKMMNRNYAKKTTFDVVFFVVFMYDYTYFFDEIKAVHSIYTEGSERYGLS